MKWNVADHLSSPEVTPTFLHTLSEAQREVRVLSRGGSPPIGEAACGLPPLARASDGISDLQSRCTAFLLFGMGGGGCHELRLDEGGTKQDDPRALAVDTNKRRGCGWDWIGAETSEIRLWSGGGIDCEQVRWATLRMERGTARRNVDLGHPTDPVHCSPRNLGLVTPSRMSDPMLHCLVSVFLPSASVERVFGSIDWAAGNGLVDCTCLGGVCLPTLDIPEFRE